MNGETRLKTALWGQEAEMGGFISGKSANDVDAFGVPVVFGSVVPAPRPRFLALRTGLPVVAQASSGPRWAGHRSPPSTNTITRLERPPPSLSLGYKRSMERCRLPAQAAQSYVGPVHHLRSPYPPFFCSRRSFFSHTMTLIKSCASEKIFRPWDETKPSRPTPPTGAAAADAAARVRASTSPVKEEPRSSPPAVCCPSPDRFLPHQLQPHHHHHHHQHHQHHHQNHQHPCGSLAAPVFSPVPNPPMHPPSLAAHWATPLPSTTLPSMEQFLATLEAASPEALHPAQLAALGMGPVEIGQLYQLAGFKPIHPGHLPYHHPIADAHPTASEASHASASGKKQRPKRFRCPHCNVAFSNNGQLKGHVRSHTGNCRSISIHST